MSLGGRKMQSLIKYVKERKVLKEKMKRLNIDFTKYDMNILEKKNIYYAYKEILNKSFSEFMEFERKVKYGK